MTPHPLAEPIEETLARLESTLSQCAPSVLSALQPGLSENEIDSLIGDVTTALPSELRALYRWRNGGPSCGPAPYFYSTCYFIPIEDAVAWRLGMQKYAQRSVSAIQLRTPWKTDHFSNDWFCIFDSVARDPHFYVDLARANEDLSWFHTDLELDEIVFFPALRNLIAAVERQWRDGAIFLNSDGEVGWSEQNQDYHWWYDFGVPVSDGLV